MQLGPRTKTMLAITIACLPILATLLLPTAVRSLAHIDIGVPAGRQPWARALMESGIDRADFPASRILPPPQPAVAAPAPPEAGTAERFAELAALPRESRWQPMIALADLHPDDMGLQAAALRYACQQGGTLRVGRESEIRPDSGRSSLSKPAAPADIAFVLRTAERGAGIEPDNAYFPAMAAVACAAAHDDDQAHRYWRRAAECRQWDEHLGWEAGGHGARAKRRIGEQPAFFDGLRNLSLLFPHYTQIRSAARLAAVQATRLEKLGEPASAARMRGDVAVVGGLLRSKGPTLIASLVGATIEATAAKQLRTTRPEGPSSAAVDPSRTDIGRRIAAELRQRGNPEHSIRWANSGAAGQFVRDLVNRSLDSGPMGMTSILRTTSSTAVRWVWLESAVLCALWMLPCAILPTLRGQFGKSAGTVLVVLIGLSALLWTAYTLAGGARDLLASAGLVQGLVGDDTTGSPSGTLLNGLRQSALWIQAGMLLPPVALAGGGLVGLGIRRPFHACATIALCVGSVIASSLWLVRLSTDTQAERITRVELAECLASEGPFLARKLNTKWPAP